MLEDQTPKVYDVVRGKFLVLTPEEWVRQHVVHWLLKERGVPRTMIANERSIQVGKRKLRVDIQVITPSLKRWLMVECKAADQPINTATWAQVAQYWQQVGSQYVLVTNGLQHQLWKAGESGIYTDLAALPWYR